MRLELAKKKTIKMNNTIKLEEKLKLQIERAKQLEIDKANAQLLMNEIKDKIIKVEKENEVQRKMLSSGLEKVKREGKNYL